MVPDPNTAQKTSRLLSSAATTNATSVKTTRGALRRIIGYNAAATARYLKIYDTAVAPTVGTDTPRKTYYLPATSGFAFDLDDYFGQGIGYGLTTAAADNSTAAVAAGDILCLNVDYL